MPESAEIALAIPGDSRFVATARVVAASLGVELEFSVDEIEELRIGVDELATMLVEVSDGDTIELRYRLTDDSLEVDGNTASTDDLADQVDAITRKIFESVVDRYEFGPGCGTIEKRRNPT